MGHQAVSLLALIFFETMLGFDNLVFISLTVNSLPAQHRRWAKAWGLCMALAIRLVFLHFLTWLAALRTPILTIHQLAIAPADLLFVLGGVFLVYKSTREIHQQLNPHTLLAIPRRNQNWRWAAWQITCLDVVFSLDSMMTAIGLTDNFTVMATSVVIAMGLMLLGSDWFDRFIHQRPAFKLLAIAFILLVGVVLTAEGLHLHIPRGYIYVTLCFSLALEGVQGFYQNPCAPKQVTRRNYRKPQGLRNYLSKPHLARKNYRLPMNSSSK